MKIKNQHGTSRSGSPAIHTLAVNNLNEDSQNSHQNWSNSSLTSTSNSQFMTPTVSTQIWTRSAVRAAQQQKLNDSSCHKHYKHHGHTQHAIGKIVKPIPVRPMSSSSSSSSTHSSQFNAKSIHSNLSNLETVNHTDSASNGSTSGNGGQNFSLIAKYFASFPATRLAKTNQIFSETNNQVNAYESTPFLPFKKSTSTANNSSNASENQPVHSTFVLRSQTASNLSNTDHLCTNFRRMIKLNEPEFRASPFNNIRNTSPAAQTPTGSDSHNNQFNSINNSASNDLSEINSQQLQMNSDFNLAYENEAMFYPASNDEETNTRLGQITMETRSTRKFLIKHHPYLQQSHSSSMISNGLNSKSFNNQRPSINLMKKLNSKRVSDEPVHSSVDYTTTNSSSNNRSGRSSRSNNSQGLNEQHQTAENHNLLKFTDTAPVFSASSKNANSKQNQAHSNKRRQMKNLTTASALSTELNQSQRKLQSRAGKKSFNRHSTSESQHNDSTADCYDCDCYDDDETDEHLNDQSCDQYYDEQEEDSSGYYSSYHSVDLISSSGGSCVGNHITSRQPKQTNWENTKLADSEHQTEQPKTNNNNTNNSVPQHHYHTRYLTHCLEQKQDMQQSVNQTSTSMSHTSINVKNIIPLNSDITSNSTIPTTRLRYQQQLAAQAANSGTKFSSHHTECDLDLDQIEND